VPFKAWVEIEVRDKKGRLIKRQKQPAKSFVKNFLKFIRELFVSVTATTAGTTIGLYVDVFTYASGILDTGGVSQTLEMHTGTRTASESVEVCLGSVNAPTGDDSHGLVAGSGTTAPTPDDTALETQYTEGTGLGNLTHGAVTVEDTTVSGSTTQFRVIRVFTNNYTATQTVAEVGLIARWRWKGSDSAGIEFTDEHKFLIARDVLSPAVDVPAGSTLTVRYILQTTT